MPNIRDLALDEFQISKWRYRELKYFCLRYGEMKRALRDVRGLSSGTPDGIPGRSAPGDLTARRAEKAAALGDSIRLIEQTAVAAAPDFYRELLKNVTEGVPWEYACPACGRRQFYEARRKFFWLLDQKKG